MNLLLDAKKKEKAIEVGNLDINNNLFKYMKKLYSSHHPKDMFRLFIHMSLLYDQT